MVVGMANEFDTFAQRAAIKVCGVGGGGGNAVDRMISAGLQDVEFIVINTDAQALKNSPAPRRLQIGLEVTGGLGSGGKPEIGQKAALEDRERLTEVLEGADMVFLTAGMGGGTGTGAAPIVAELAKSTGALTLGIVTLPFSFEGSGRMDNAIEGLAELEEQVDSLIVIPNDRVAALGQTEITFLNAFEQADEVLHNGVRAITNLIQVHGLWNVDFADFRTVMEGGGRALMGIGRAEGERRAVRAAEEAIVCPLLQQSNIDGATGIIVNIRGGRDIGMRELEESVQVVKAAACSDATLFVGAALHDEERPELEITVIAAGFAGAESAAVEIDFPIVAKTSEPDSTPALAPCASEAAEPSLESTQPSLAFAAAGSAEVEPGYQAEFFPEDGRAQPAPAAVAGGVIVDFDSHESTGGTDEGDISIPTWLRRRKKARP
ncbi:MAG: cell division protein FtsZ [Nitrospiraceae bacterium]|nr:cell division protein FtsZ [Nitrospiraceae bacterium]